MQKNLPASFFYYKFIEGCADFCTTNYVANSPYTVLGEYMSAGRLYDKIGKQAIGTIKIVTGNGIICAVSTKKIK